eukprot:750443-Hanusia_phi.AAC.4
MANNDEITFDEDLEPAPVRSTQRKLMTDIVCVSPAPLQHGLMLVVGDRRKRGVSCMYLQQPLRGDSDRSPTSVAHKRVSGGEDKAAAPGRDGKLLSPRTCV